MALLPADLDRALHAVGASVAEREEDAAALADIRERMGAPPASREVRQWLAELVAMGLLERGGKDRWTVTEDGWRAINLISPPEELE